LKPASFDTIISLAFHYDHSFGNIRTDRMHKQQVIIYPEFSADGLGSAWAAWEFFGDGAYYKPYRYNDPLPTFEKGAEVFVLSCGIPLGILYEAAIKAERIVVIEIQSHYEAKYLEQLNAKPVPHNVTFIINSSRSACVMTWEFFNHTKTPLLLEMIQDHNQGRFSIETSSDVVAALNNRLPMDIMEFGGISVGELRSEGKALNEQTRRIATSLMKARHAVCLGDIVGMAVNAPSAFANDLGLMLSMERGSFGMTYHFNGERNAWLCSLRSDSSVNVGLLAERFGGGGNERAAGFSVKGGASSLSFLGIV
jgi:nanoRNase/pAp phosphatase (c-di-AMP/oligoRNAs hydrolase)